MSAFVGRGGRQERKRKTKLNTQYVHDDAAAANLHQTRGIECTWLLQLYLCVCLFYVCQTVKIRFVDKLKLSIEEV